MYNRKDEISSNDNGPRYAAVSSIFIEWYHKIGRKKKKKKQVTEPPARLV